MNPEMTDAKKAKIAQLLEMRQLEFLLAETANWPEADVRSKPYAERLAALKERLSPPEAAQAQPAEPAPTLAAQEAQPIAAAPIIEKAPALSSRESLPFDQWILSERNIKIALYSGGALLVLAGLIFVSANWTRLPGPAKFSITLLVTGLMYLGGYLLCQRPALKPGGIALLGVGSGLAPLNFVVLQIYIFSARGLSANAMWLIGSLPILLLYILIAYWTRADLFTYLSLGALASATTAAMLLLEAPLLLFLLVYALLALVVLLGARAFQPTRLAGFTRTPLLIVSQVAMPVLFFSSLGLWAGEHGCNICRGGSPWLAIIAMLIAVLFYIATDTLFHWLIARWAAAFAFALTFVFTLTELRFSSTMSGVSLMVLALVYLLVGYALGQRSGKPSEAWPLYAAGYAVAVLVTFKAMAAVRENPDALAKILIGDVILLAVSAWARRQYGWVYGAAWVFIAPVYIYATLYVPDSTNRGLVLGVLMLNYVAAGYALGRRALRLGEPFLTAAVFLSIVVPMLTWSNAVVASIIFVLIALLYLLAALWRGWSWLLFPALLAVNLAVVTILRIFFTRESPWEETLTIIYAGLGMLLVISGAWLRRAGQKDWGRPLYIVATLEIMGAYLECLTLGDEFAIGFSLLFAALAFGLAWVERAAFANLKIPPLLTYLGVILVCIGYLYAINLASPHVRAWPAYNAALCALFIVLAWFLRAEPVKGVYGTPLRLAGLWLVLLPLALAVEISRPLVAAITFAIAGAAYAADAAVRRILYLGYLAVGAFIGMLWAILLHFEVGEMQAYAVPLGLALLAVGWNERRRGERESYRWPTILGLLALMGTAFYQSLDEVIYAVLLLVESLVALGWGIRIRSRGYVQLGVLSLVANGIAQLGPGFVNLSRWLQIGIIGAILLSAGMVALFRREQLLATRRRLTEEWRRWEA